MPIPSSAENYTLQDYSIEKIQLKNSQDAFRTVGFLEYAQALRRLDVVIRTATPAELEAFDGLVKERDEFAVFTNLSRRVQNGPSTLAEPAERADDNFQRRGLAWITALARVELGAIAAALTDVADPFGTFGPTAFDFVPYREFLLDGLRTHYWALFADPGLAQVGNAKSFDMRILSYIRRLIVVQTFHQAVVRIGGRDLSPVQQEELTAWGRRLGQTQQILVGKVQTYLAVQEMAKERKRELSECDAACKRLLQRQP